MLDLELLIAPYTKEPDDTLRGLRRALQRMTEREKQDGRR
jgi:hypothetical protein